MSAAELATGKSARCRRQGCRRRALAAPATCAARGDVEDGSRCSGVEGKRGKSIGQCGTARVGGGAVSSRKGIRAAERGARRQHNGPRSALHRVFDAQDSKTSSKLLLLLHGMGRRAALAVLQHRWMRCQFPQKSIRVQKSVTSESNVCPGKTGVSVGVADVDSYFKIRGAEVRAGERGVISFRF